MELLLIEMSAGLHLLIIRDSRIFVLGYEDVTTGKENVGRPRKRRKEQQP